MLTKLPKYWQSSISQETMNSLLDKNKILPMLNPQPVFKPQRRDTTISKTWELGSQDSPLPLI